MTIHHATPIVTHRIEFAHEDSSLVGTLFAPRNAAGPLPGIVVTGSWTTVKEQMAGLYARRMAAEGFAALAFDFAGFGESGGQPRDVESPARKVRDIHAAVGALGEQPNVDKGRIGALAVCASSGYTAINTADDDRIRSLALVAPWLHDAKLVREVYGGEDGVRQRIEAGDEARAHYEQTGDVEYVPAVSTSDQSAAMFGDFTYYLDSSRGAVPEWPNRFAVMSWPEWLRFDPIPIARDVRVPTVVVHSTDAAVPDGARRFFDDLSSSKAILWTTGTQLDFYDQEPNVTIAVDTVAAHFRRSLGDGR